MWKCKICVFLFVLFSLLVVWNRYRKIEIVGICGIAKWFGIHKFYVTDVEKRYGKVLEGAEIIGGIDLLFGTVIPIYEFTDKQGKHMAWGVYRIKVRELEQKLNKKCQIYYAPGKTECVME